MNRRALTLAALLAIAAPMIAAAPSDAGAKQRYDRRDRNDRGRNHVSRRHRQERWDRRRHNGYFYNNRFHYGPPPQAYYGREGLRLGYRAWARGAQLPSYYRHRYAVVRDWRRRRLAPPPRGCHWVRDDRGDYLLVGIATGLIVSVILSDGRYGY